MIQNICYFLAFKVFRWQVKGEIPTLPKFIYVVVPHTSNWDFVWGWLAIRGLGLDITIFVKDAYFTWPLNYFCGFFNCAPVNRRESTNFVDAIARQYKERDRLAALITPEGTRKKVAAFKSGYYYLGKHAEVPLVIAGIDYRDRSVTLLPPRAPFATFEEDHDHLLAFCNTMHGKNPENSFR